MADIALWNGDICDLEVDAIVSPASPNLWMATGVAGAIKRRGGDVIEFAAVRQGPADVGDAIVTSAGSLAARWVIHAVSLDHDAPHRLPRRSIARSGARSRVPGISASRRSRSRPSAPASAASRSRRRPG